MATEATESKAFEPVLSLKWTENGADIRNTFQPLHLWEQFNDMRINRTYCDVDIVLLETSESAPVSFSVHSCIVALSSTLFKRILSKDCMRKKITLQSVRRKSIETCIKYMYGQEVYIAFEDLDEISLTASRLQMKFLQLHCQALRSSEQNSCSDSSSLEKELEPKAAKGKSTANNSKTAKDTPSVVKNNTDKKSTNTNLKEKDELTRKGNKSRALQNSYASPSRKEEHSYSSKEHVKEKKIVNDKVGLSGNYDVSNDDSDGSDHTGDSDRMETKEEINNSKPETEENDVEIIDTDEETNDGTISCDHCSKTFHTRQQLKSHKLTVAMSVIKKRYEIKKSFSKIDCKSEISNMDSDVKPEDSLIKNEGEIKIKMKRQKGKKFAKAMCELCGQVFMYPRSLMYHLRDKICQKERPTKCIPRRIRMFTCEKCGVQVKGYSAFVRHKEVAHTLRFVCRYCGKVWAYEYQRIEHEKRHRGERTLKCDLCDYMGVSTFEVKQHKKRAHNNMQFPCPNCSKVFHAEADRRNHIRRIHMRETSFTCDHCPYTAHSAYYLRNHIERVHNKDEEAQFPCTVCGKLLSSFSSLRRHLRNVHKTDPPMKTPRLIRQMQQAETGNDQLESSEGLVNIEVSEDQIEHVFVESTPLQTFSQTTPTVTVPYQQGLPIETVNYENVSITTEICMERYPARREILGQEGTPYHRGVFKLEILIPERYPMEPPKMRFLTPIYHPNIDDAGRICLDSLKMPPAGSWKPALNLSTLLTTLQLLLAEPNPDDPLMTDIANEYRYNRPLFEQHAREWTEKHAIQTVKPSTTEGQQVASGKKSGPQYSSSESESSDEEMDQENVGMTSISRKRQVVDQADNTLQENVKKLKP